MAERLSDLLNQINHTDPAFIDAVPQLDVVEELDLPPTLAEVEKAIYSLKCRSSAGLDDLQGEVLRYSGNRVNEEIFNYIRACWNTDRILSRWKPSKIIGTYKRKGDKSECGISRGKSLLTVAGKVYAKLLLMRLFEHVSESVLPESQNGFRNKKKQRLK